LDYYVQNFSSDKTARRNTFDILYVPWRYRKEL